MRYGLQCDIVLHSERKCPVERQAQLRRARGGNAQGRLLGDSELPQKTLPTSRGVRAAPFFFAAIVRGAASQRVCFVRSAMLAGRTKAREVPPPDSPSATSGAALRSGSGMTLRR